MAEWTIEEVIQKRIESELEILVKEYQKSVIDGSKEQRSARIMAELHFIKKKYDSEKHWRKYFAKQLEEEKARGDKLYQKLIDATKKS